jgi:hypothetical protein
MSDKLLPVPDEASAPFFEGASQGKLMLQCCSACSTWLYPVKQRCPECGGTDLVWKQASGRGTLFSHGVQHRAAHPSLESRLPITLAVVDLDEGVRMSANLIDAEPGAVRAGMAVEVAFEQLADEVALPVFRARS